MDVPQPLRLGAIKGRDDLHASDSRKGPAQALKALCSGAERKLELSVPKLNQAAQAAGFRAIGHASAAIRD
jgi:hypothetical protein